jgi:membrane protein
MLAGQGSRVFDLAQIRAPAARNPAGAPGVRVRRSLQRAWVPMPSRLRPDGASWMLVAAAAFAGAALLLARREGTVADAARQQEQGRGAEAPAEIPPRGWKDILLRVYRSISQDRVLAVAAGVTFYALLALFPAIAALVSLYGLFADPASIERHLEVAAGFLPGGGLDVIREQMQRVAANANSTLGLGVAVGLAISLWSANAGMKALFDALNVAYGESEKRGFLKLTAISLAFTLGAILLVLVAIGAMVAVPILLKFLPLRSSMEWLVSLLRWPLLLAALVFALAVLYRYGPSRDQPRWRWVTWGSVLAGAVWVGASALFSWYAANFGSYNETYGSLGAAVGFMTWIWISTIVILLGAEINAETEHQTARDTTRGPPRPLGTRGAVVADTVAPQPR